MSFSVTAICALNVVISWREADFAERQLRGRVGGRELSVSFRLLG